MGVAFIKVSVLYFMIGVTLGLYIGIADQFQYTSAHAHINLLGWVSSALAGVIYLQIPRLGSNRLARVHFWLFTIGIPLLIFSMICFALGMFEVGVPLSAVGSILIIASVFLFVINIVFNLKSTDGYAQS